MNADEMHKLLARQVRRHFGSADAVPDSIVPFVQSVEMAYRQADEDRALLEHSMETVSTELAERFQRMRNAIGERDEVQQALSLMEAALEASTYGVLILDLDGNVVKFNRQFAGMWRGIVPALDGADGSAVLSIVAGHLQDPDTFHRIISERRTLETSAEFELLRTNDGRVLQLTAHPQRLGDKVVGCVWRFGDVTEREQIADQLRQSQKMEAVGQLAGGVAHDFNNLLTVIRGNAELLATEEDSTLFTREVLLEITRATNRAAELTGQLLAFSRKQTLKAAAFDLGTIVQGLEPMLRRVIGTDIDFRTHRSPDPIVVSADRGQLDQVLLNLVINARDAMPDGGRLSIDASLFLLTEARDGAQGDVIPPGEYGVLQVRDSGSGISPELRQHIFEPFFTTKAPGKGTGLGLSMVYGIVRQSRGFIEVESAPELGTTFRIYLPLGTALSHEVAVPTPVRPAVPRGKTVLIAEDEDSVRRLVRTLLEREGFITLEAVNGLEALDVEAQHEGDIDLIISDVIMPELGGRQLADQIRQRRPGLPVLFMSGYTRLEISDENGVLNAGAGFLHKPFTTVEFITAVREALSAAA